MFVFVLLLFKGWYGFYYLDNLYVVLDCDMHIAQSVWYLCIVVCTPTVTYHKHTSNTKITPGKVSSKKKTCPTRLHPNKAIKAKFWQAYKIFNFVFGFFLK